MRSRIVAHRGDHREAPENSLASFKGLGSLGVDGVELDVQLTADDVPVVAHDVTIAGRRIEALSHEALQALQGDALGEDWEIPTLEAALHVLPDHFLVNLELKSSRLSPSLTSTIGAAQARFQLIVTSLDAQPLLALRDAMPDVTTGLVSGTYVRDQLAGVKGARADLISLEWRLAELAVIDELRANGVAVYVWTVNTDAALERMLELGVDGIITDRPLRALELVSGRAS